MRLILTAAAASLAIVTAACQKSAETADTNAANDTMMNEGIVNDMSSANGMAMAPMAASDFAATVAGSNMYEIESGKLAQTMATNADLKAFADKLVADHTKLNADLKAAAAASSPAVTLPTAIPAELQGKIDALKAAKGADFDKLFVEQQIDAHHKASDALESYATSGDSPSLKAFAAKAKIGVDAHDSILDAMKI